MSQQKQFKHLNIVLAIIFILLSVGALYNGQQAYAFHLEIVGKVTPVTDVDIKNATSLAITASLSVLAYLPMACLLFVSKKSCLYIIPAAILALRYLYTLFVQIYATINIFDFMSRHKGVMLDQVRGLISVVALTLVAVTVLICVIRNAKGQNLRIIRFVLLTSLVVALVLILVSLGMAKECSEEFGVIYSKNIYLMHLDLVLKVLAMPLIACAVRIFGSEGITEEFGKVDVV